MTENAKTITFVTVGLLAIVIGLVTRPSSAELDEQSLVGQDLTKNFDTPEEAKRLRIVRFDEDTATLREFEVAEEDGLWSIPSKDGYPADAARQMAEAATSLIDRKILAVASRTAGDHEEFGVTDPLSPKLEVGQKGVGTRVTMSDIHGQPLVDLIVGKAVKDAEGQRYVREAGRDIVYVIEIDRSKLSTNFEDWIEKDLLKLNSWDLKQVQIKDYSAELVQGMTPDGQFGIGIERNDRAEMTFAYNEGDSTWTAVELRHFNPTAGGAGQYVEFKLADDEELNEEALNGLKTALDDLQIVDVVRKPAGLSQDLKAGEDFLNNREALIDLMTKGFTAAPSATGAPGEIISSDGEVIATMKNGAEYVLRFGNLTNVGSGAKDGEAAADDAQSPAEGSDVNRYLFVMARFNESAVKQPELEELPELPAEEPAAQASAEEGDVAEPQSTPTDSDEAPDDGTDAEEPQDAADDTTDAETSEETTADDAESEDAATDGSDAEKDKDVEAIIADRKRIETENQRKLDEFQETLDKGRETVKELNLRFGDWYFVVNDEVFKKVRLGRDDVVKKKEKTDAAGEPASAGGTERSAAPGAAIPGLPPIPGTQP